jgi:hypothetical protein
MDDMGYNSGGHQQHVLKITRGEYGVQSTQLIYFLGLLVIECCVKEKSFLILQAYMYNNSVICVIK